jgi:hypothetical protein
MLQLRVGDRQFLISPEGVATIMGVVKDCEVMGEKHIGTNKGTQGYDNSYVPIVYKPTVLSEALPCKPVDEDLIDTIKLTMKLNDYKPPY